MHHDQPMLHTYPRTWIWKTVQSMDQLWNTYHGLVDLNLGSTDLRHCVRYPIHPYTVIPAPLELNHDTSLPPPPPPFGYNHFPGSEWNGPMIRSWVQCFFHNAFFSENKNADLVKPKCVLSMYQSSQFFFCLGKRRVGKKRNRLEVYEMVSNKTFQFSFHFEITFVLQFPLI